MEIAFKKESVRCQEWCLQEVQNAEQTLEIKLPEGMGDIGQVLAAWGQPIARGKEWHSEYVSFTGGMMVWVLYAPEEGGPPQSIEGWIPFQLRWELPEGARDGELRFDLACRFVDARSTSARKLMVRAGLGVLAEGLVPVEREWSIPQGEYSQVALRRETYSPRLCRLLGEKTFLLSEELTLPSSSPKPEKLICYTLSPEVTEQKVLTDKVVFRGNGGLHLLYLGEDGLLHSWEHPLSFSQLAQLEESLGTDAQAQVCPLVTSLELELGENGALQLKAGLVGQYMVDAPQQLELVTDAYSPGYQLQLERGSLELPVILETRTELLEGEAELKGQGSQLTDIWITQDIPQLRRRGEESQLVISGTVQTLHYGDDGSLKTGSARYQEDRDFPADASARVIGTALPIRDLRTGQSREETELTWQAPIRLTTLGNSPIPMITGITLGEKRPQDPNRPSLILRRADGDLWELAKATDSTVEAIQKANHLTAAPTPGQMLLIPVTGD